MPLIGNAAAHRRMIGDRGGEMPARRPAADQQPFAVEAQFARALGEEGQRLAHFGDDIGEPRIGRQRVAGHRDVDAMRVRAESR